MKTSWLIGIAMAWLVVFMLEIMATGGTDFMFTSSGITNIAANNSGILSSPIVSESTNIFTAAWAIITSVAGYLVVLIKMLFLWCPTVFASYGAWFWWLICFPIDIGIVASIVFIVRGVHSG